MKIVERLAILETQVKTLTKTQWILVVAILGRESIQFLPL